MIYIYICIIYIYIYIYIWNWVKFTHHNLKGKFYAPVFSISSGFPYKVNNFVKMSTQESVS